MTRSVTGIPPRTIRRAGAAVCVALLLAARAVFAAPAFDAEAWLAAAPDKIIWAHNEDLPLPPASLTKIMTIMLVLQKTAPEEVVTVSPRAAAETGSRIGLKAGDRVYAGLLAAAALMGSANDACLALAEHVGGGEAAFVAMMNEEAARQGLSRTRFQNACGHDTPGNVSSARDMLTLARAAMRLPLFAAIVAERTLRFTTVDGKRTFSLKNKNALIGRYPGAVGVKTGFTEKAGKCLVALVRRKGAEVMLVALNAKERWWSSVRILDAALREQGVDLYY